MRNRRKNWFAKVELHDKRMEKIWTLVLKLSLWTFSLEVDSKCHEEVLSKFSFHLRLVKVSISKYHKWPYFVQGSEGTLFPP